MVQYNTLLEKLSNDIRLALQIKSEEKINIDYLETLVSKINETFTNFKIEKNNYFNYMNLSVEDDKKIININYNDKADNDVKVDFVLHAFCYGLLLNEEEMSNNSSQTYNVPEAVIFSNNATRYLAEALMLPKNQFFDAMVEFSRCDGAVDIEGMQKKLKNKHIVSRGKALNIWY